LNFYFLLNWGLISSLFDELYYFYSEISFTLKTNLH